MVDGREQITDIQMQDARSKKQDIFLKIHDITGRLVKSFKLATRYSLLATYTLAVLIFCYHANEWHRMRSGNFEMITKGTYCGKPRYLAQAGEYEILVKKFRAEIEKNIDVLVMITKKFFFAPKDLDYQFKFTSLDKEKNYLILRYFARILNHPVYAGYQIQFVFDLNLNKLTEIYTAEVPLE